MESWFQAIAKRKDQYAEDPEKLRILEALEKWGDDLLAGIP